MGDDDEIMSRVRADYREVISAVRAKLSDEQIVDILERYVHGPMHRDDAIDALDIDYLGTLHEMIAVYRIERPEIDPVEEARQAEMMRLVFKGEEVPMEMRQPAAWRKH